jgi:xanthine dehydrogenase YagS FAD-binding subunit
MKQLHYLVPTDVADAVNAVSGDPQARFLAGGTNLVDHLKLGVSTPDTLIDVRKLPLHDVEETDAGLRIGANVANSDLAAHPAVHAGWPGVSRALLAGASAQIRNQATTGGNLLQRTRCVYFQDVTTPCNKREPGSGCSAIGGYERYNAVLGASDACVATHPSDLAVALTSLDAEVTAVGQAGERHIPLAALHRLPGEHPDKDTVLEHGELITAVELPSTDLARNSTYVKARDRASFAFALVSVAAALRLEDGLIAEVALAWGGVAHTPWRATRAEAALLGQPVTEDTITAAVDAELQDAQFSADTAYKRPMLRGATVSALLQLGGEEN